MYKLLMPNVQPSYKFIWAFWYSQVLTAYDFWNGPICVSSMQEGRHVGGVRLAMYASHYKHTVSISQLSMS